MRTLLICAALAVSAPTFTLASPPAAPTLHVNARFKGLQFDWVLVASAGYYNLEYRAHQNSPFVTLTSLPGLTTSAGFSFPLHLYDWTYARYRLAACNSDGCTRSAEVSVSALRRDSVGYFKAQSGGGGEFGADVDQSPDGKNFATVAPDAVFFDNDGAEHDGVAYVFRRGSNGVWAQAGRLAMPIPPYIGAHNIIAMDVGISATGNTVAVGMPSFEHQANDQGLGEVAIFHWGGTSWTRMPIPRVPSSLFGEWVEVADSGFTLAVGYRGQDANSDSRVAIYKVVNSKWQNVRTITSRTDNGESCGSHAFSRDGSTIAQLCTLPAPPNGFASHFIRIYSGDNWSVRTDVPVEASFTSASGYSSVGLGISANGDTVAAQIAVTSAQTADEALAQVNVYKRTSGVYSKVAELTPGAWSDHTYRYFYGEEIAFSGDGATLAVGDFSDAGQGQGPRAAPLLPGGPEVGAVYVYRLSGTWNLANMVKPNYTPSPFAQDFGRVLALNGNGQTLLVGQPDEDSNASGIGGNWQNTDSPDSGAVWMY